jgi:hypothetical protein
MKPAQPRECRRAQRAATVFAAVSVFAMLCLVACAGGSKQVADESFDAIVRDPSWTRNGARVLFDEGHDNFHTMSGRYAPFARLLGNDGFRLTPNAAPFTEASLAAADILVIANARGAGSPESPAFREEEIAAVEEWVRGGGSLLLVADHEPFGAAARELGERFGVTMGNDSVRDRAHQDPLSSSPYILAFRRSDGLLGEHPILRGRSSTESIDTVVTFGGQSLSRGEGIDLLPFSPTAESVAKPNTPDEAARPAAGLSQAVAIEHGAGRVVILGEAALLSAQVITGDAAKAMGVEELRIGVSRTDTDNRQFALNVMRWLARLF